MKNLRSGEEYAYEKNDSCRFCIMPAVCIIRMWQKRSDRGKDLCRYGRYKYRLEVSGRMNAAESDSTFIYLSNQESIPFDQAWKASGLSSNMADYFDEADAKFVGMK